MFGRNLGYEKVWFNLKKIARQYYSNTLTLAKGSSKKISTYICSASLDASKNLTKKGKNPADSSHAAVLKNLRDEEDICYCASQNQRSKNQVPTSLLTVVVKLVLYPKCLCCHHHLRYTINIGRINVFIHNLKSIPRSDRNKCSSVI